MVRAGIKEAHPAGIWSDMTSDGPVIGTMVVVLDRAKNLPNKKKIGKQDPYAVARLAKAAQRTDTDVRGGQVPRWDKELRFPVRDSPDYKTLKISVFNDDKKTDLIGECSVRLDKILVKGGGTDDGWRGLKCKEKYAGEILVELTFYDLRPKDEPKRDAVVQKVVEKEVVREVSGPRKLGGAREMGARAAAPQDTGTARERVKRRPLPGNPTERQPSPDKNEERRTRRSRHSYHPERDQQRELRKSQSRYFEEAPEMRTSKSRREEEPELRRSQSRYFEEEEEPERRRELRHSQSRVFDNVPDLRHSQSRYFEEAPEMRMSRSRQEEEPQPQLRHSQSRYFEEAPDMRTSRSRQGEEPRELRHAQSRYFEEEQRHDLRHSQSKMFGTTPPGLRHSQSRMFDDQPPAPPIQQLGHSRSRTLGQADLRHSASRYFETGGVAMTPQAVDTGGRPEIYDPFNNDGIIPGGRAEDFNDYDAGPPPPPPAHGPPPPAHRQQLFDAPPMQHSISSGPPDLTPPPMHLFDHQLRHFQSVPAFQQRDITPQLEQYGGSFNEPHYAHQALANQSAMQPVFQNDSFPAPLPTGPLDAGPPPPPPPHRHTLPPEPPMQQEPVVDEPNWDNHRPKSTVEEHGLPAYAAIPPTPPVPTGALIRRGSFIPGDVSARNGIPNLPPSLIPGLDPVVAEVLSERLDEERRMTPYNPESTSMPLHSSGSRTGTNYHRPQVEEVQDVQIYQPAPDEPAFTLDPFAKPRPNTLKKKRAPMVKPMPIHGEQDPAVPALNSTSRTSLHIKPERKPLPVAPSDLSVGTMPFGPDSYNIINPNPAASLEALHASQPSAIMMPGSTRAINPSDVLPPHTHAPEPLVTRRQPRAPPPVPAQHRRERFDRPLSLVSTRSISPNPPRGPRLSLPAPPEQVIHKQVSFEDRPRSGGGLVLYDPHSERERERQADRERMESDSRALVRTDPNDPRRREQYQYARQYAGQPPALPPKVPMQTGGVGREALVLSQELSLINLGTGTGGRQGRRRY